jgi:anti-anti-sigma factor
MQIVERRVGDVTILQLRGRLIVEEGDLPLQKHVDELLREGHLRFLLDMGQVTRLDSAGIGMLVSKLVSVRRRGGTMKLLHLTSHTGRLLGITRLVNVVFECFESEEEALRSFGLEPV